MKHPQPAFGLLWALLLVPARAESQDRMWFPDQQVSAGAKAEKFFLHASHEFDLTGFSISVRYLPAELQVTAVSTAGTSIEELPDPLGFWNGRNNAVKGEIGYGAVFDLNPPLTSVLPPSPDRTLVRISADVLAAPGGSTTLELKDGLGDASPIFNVLVDPTGHSIRPVLQSGTITVESPPLLAEAGPDQFAPESSVVTLDGSASRSSEDLPLTYAWNQVAGPPAQLRTDSADPQPQYALPALGDGDVALVFELTVSDGLSQAVDRTTVTAVDRDLRRGVL